MPDSDASTFCCELLDLSSQKGERIFFGTLSKLKKFIAREIFESW